MKFSDLAGQHVVIWGFGREGKSVANRCHDIGIDTTVAEPDLEHGPRADIVYGPAGRAAILGADVVVKSPGVPVTSDLYQELVRLGIPVTSLTDLWMSENSGRVVAVTGTKGKSTTASLINHLLSALGHRSILRGNIGTNVLAEPNPPAEVVVMELSSYQAQSLSVSPRIVVVTSLFPEHLTWHGSEEAYYADKLSAVAHGPESVIAPADADDLVRRVRELISPETLLMLTDHESVHADPRGNIVWPDGTRVGAEHLPLHGLHQAGNVALALRVAELFGGTSTNTVGALESFKPLPHRMERIESTDGRVWIDDSLATAPEAVVATLQSLPGQPVSVIVGGADRGLDFRPLLEYLDDHPDVRLLLIGPAGARIAPQSRGILFLSFADALEWARSDANVSRVVLLSPGAPSYDEFENYEGRSAAFRAAALRSHLSDTSEGMQHQRKR